LNYNEIQLQCNLSTLKFISVTRCCSLLLQRKHNHPSWSPDPRLSLSLRIRRRSRTTVYTVVGRTPTPIRPFQIRIWDPRIWQCAKCLHWARCAQVNKGYPVIRSVVSSSPTHRQSTEIKNLKILTN